MNIFKILFSKEPAPDLKPLIDAGAILLDVRTVGEFAAGHVPNSINIPLDQLQQRLPKLSKSSVIIVFCQSGGRSRVAKSLLEQYGFTGVVNGESWRQVQKCMER